MYAYRCEQTTFLRYTSYKCIVERQICKKKQAVNDKEMSDVVFLHFGSC